MIGARRAGNVVSAIADHKQAQSRATAGSMRMAFFVTTAFVAALFLSALLLFSVQPMFAKMVLPRFGGSPAVWSVATVFFQGVLLLGYAYAHALSGRINIRSGALLHIGLMIVVLIVALPFGIGASWDRPPADGQVLWLIGLFAASIGLPFFVLSANGPLLQAWFSKTDHPHAGDPYPLYAASNFGSLLALLTYPFVIEPISTLSQQRIVWTWGFATFIALIALAAGYAIRQTGQGVSPPADSIRTVTPRPTVEQKLVWIALSFAPSGLLVAVTAHLSTDVAAAPFLWVLPLSLFLLTFVIAFQRKPWIPHARVAMLQPFAVLAIATLALASLIMPLWLVIAVLLCAFFLLVLFCHGELVLRRPASDHLTAFYIYMSLGGVLGGVFAGLVAPLIFNNVYEYPLMFICALACKPDLWREGKGKVALAIVAAAGVALIATFAFNMVRGFDPRNVTIALQILLAIVIFGVYKYRASPRFVLAAAVAVFVVKATEATEVRPIETARSFFGVKRVVESADGRFRILEHGTTFHGVQRIRSDDGSDVMGRPEPLAYYHRNSAMAAAITAVRATTGLGAIGIVGLGAGSLACYARPLEDWRFFEIDPDVVRLARDTKYFNFLANCAPQAPIIIGDARLTLGDEPPHAKDIIVIDAFSSDSIPVHLLTREAIGIYLDKLKPDGMLVFHISNRHLDLATVIAAIGSEYGLTMRQSDEATAERQRQYRESRKDWRLPAQVIAVARTPATLAPLTEQTGWVPLARDVRVRAWTDDYSNVFSAMVRGR